MLSPGSNKFSVNDNCRDFFMANGYVVLRDLFSALQIECVSNDVCHVFATLLGKVATTREVVLQAFEHHAEQWRVGARQIHNSLSLLRTAGDPMVIAALKKVGLMDPMNWVHPEGRIDIPRSINYLQPWHQDWRSGQGSLNSVTIWMPLHDVGKKDGAIELIPGSHLWGLLPIEELQNPRRFSIVDPRIGNAAKICAELNAGECILFSQMLVHRSGVNENVLPRLTVQLRYSDRSEQNFIANEYRFPVGSELVWPSAPSADAMKRVYSAAK